MAHVRNPYRPSSRRFLVAEHYFNGDSEKWTQRQLERQLGTTLVFSKNVNGRRIPSPLSEQREQLRRTIRSTFKLLSADPQNREARDAGFKRSREEREQNIASAIDEARTATGAEEERGQEETREEEREQEETREERVQVRDNSLRADAQRLLDWIQKRWRPTVEQRNTTGQAVDSVGMRPAINGARMLRQGIPVEAIQDSLTMDYPDDLRATLGVRAQDVRTLNPQPRDGLGESVKNGSDPEHRTIPYVLALARARVPIYLYGGKGTGKTEIARQLARKLELSFGMVSMSPGTSPSAFFGRPKLTGEVTPSKWFTACQEGGVFLFDEIDNGEPDLLTLLNAAMANGHFTNDVTGEEVKLHPNLILVAAGNTIGKGSEGGYLRRPLDEATLDRWSAGRVRVDLDEQLEAQLFWKELA
jgi:hypothetical protein